MPRMIDADALDMAFTDLRWGRLPGTAEETLAHWGDRKDWCLHGSEVEKLIADAPTIDAVHVVRCEDCQYWQPPTRAEQEDGSTVGHCTAALNGQQTDAYWFCADGTR